jgi:arylsulfatase A-like enzyme
MSMPRAGGYRTRRGGAAGGLEDWKARGALGTFQQAWVKSWANEVAVALIPPSVHSVVLSLTVALPLLALLGCSQRVEGIVRIVLITVDTLRYDGFEPMHGRPSLMPETYRLAQQGVILRRHYSATSTTQPTHASILTGLHPWQHGVYQNGVPLRDGFETVAERMKQAGFSTGAVVASFPLYRGFGFARGFDDYDEEFTETFAWQWGGLHVPEARFYSLAGSVTQKAIGLMDRASGKKQFFWFHYFDPHPPYGDLAGGEIHWLPWVRSRLEKPETLADARAMIPVMRKAYDRDVRALDDSLRVLIERIRREEDEFETHILFASDHGEAFGESGSVGHGARLTEELIHVPCFIHSPRMDPHTSDIPTGSVDLAATILSLAGLDARKSEGRDLIGTTSEEGPVVGMRRPLDEEEIEYRTDGKPYRLAARQFYAVAGGRVYKGDQGSIATNDTEPVDEQTAERMKKLFATFERELDAVASKVTIDAKEREALEALGYAQ